MNVEIISQHAGKYDIRSIIINYVDEIRRMAPEDVKSEIRDVIKYLGNQLGVAGMFCHDGIHYALFGAVNVTLVDAWRVGVTAVSTEMAGDDSIFVLCQIDDAAIHDVEGDIGTVLHLAALTSAEVAYRRIIGAITTH